MIPHRMLSNEVVVNGLKGRISACRKRLRDQRPTHKGLIDQFMSDEPSGLDGCFAELTPDDTNASETFIVEQGVGIT